MKQIRIFVSLIVLYLFAPLFVYSAEPQTTPVRELRVLSIGNSFSVCLNPFFTQVTKSVPGCSVIWDHITIGGCSLERHWSNIKRESSDPKYRFFKEFTYREKLQGQRWDIVSIQQSSPLSWKPETYFPYAENIRDFVKTNAPQAELIFQQTWSYRPDEPRLASWKIDQQIMYDALNNSYRQAADKLGIRVIPVGEAIQLARKTQPGGYQPFKRSDYTWPNLPDMKGFLVGNVHWSKDHKTLEGDAYHLNARGRYLQACVWFAFLYNHDPTEITFVPKEIEPQDAVFLRHIAKQTVFNNK